MIVTQEEVTSRFFRIGAGGAVAGAIHILTLLLGWYIETDGGVILTLTGYDFIESFLFSIIGGLMAGFSLLTAYFVKRLGAIKAVIGGLTTIGGLLALSSPVYVYVFKILEVNLRGYPDLGFFAAIFTGIIELGIGALILLTPLKKEIVYPVEATTATVYPPPPVEPSASFPPTGRRAATATVAHIDIAEDVEEGVCTICYYPLTSENAVKCSACGALFHRDCIDAWVNLNHFCPSCRAAIYG
ncbi:MAG: hypothetical protein LZ168_07955 [Thaumarchaeota archaeon]|nr:hypothetical protein [Candidatus Geocrenenecus arthurdayi]MCL7389013.1 hypothetical protein [Candidatus Geocrenenecus arthurdayi]MCL7402696.1 hypothetical protein [Candidatus Geocrenenecus arthurdayi]